MPTPSKLSFLLIAVYAVTVALPNTTGGHYRLEAAPAGQAASSHEVPQTQTKDAESDDDGQDDIPPDELAPAAVQLDVSNLSPLLQELYLATRETKEQAVLARLAHTKELIESGADLKVTDSQGRTALHWAIFGSS